MTRRQAGGKKPPDVRIRALRRPQGRAAKRVKKSSGTGNNRDTIYECWHRRLGQGKGKGHGLKGSCKGKCLKGGCNNHHTNSSRLQCSAAWRFFFLIPLSVGGFVAISGPYLLAFGVVSSVVFYTVAYLGP